MSEFAIEVDGLQKTYREGWIFRKRFEALRGVTFSVPRGKVFGLLGPNGAGKTTFLKILLGVIRKSGGRASMLGYPAGSRIGRSKVGFLPERLRIPSHLTGLTALEYFGNLGNVPNATIKARQDSLLELVGLRGREREKVRKYSKGMQQRLGLAQALLNEPELLVLDEPTDGLDPQARAEIRAIINRLSDQGVTVFLNSHILQEVELVCDNVAILDQGTLRYCGNVDQIGEFVRTGSDGSASGTKVGFRVLGDADQIRLAVTELGGNTHEVPDFGGVGFSAQFQNQAEVDAAVDRLRASQISIVGITTEKISLEEAFLKIVEQPESDPEV